MTSCKTTVHNVTDVQANSTFITATIADLKVDNKKITFTMTYPERSVARGGVQNCINKAINEALKEYGGDVLLQTEEAYVTRRGLFRRRIKSVTVTGYIAKYYNFHSVGEGDRPIIDAYKAKSATTPSKGFLGIFNK